MKLIFVSIIFILSGCAQLMSGQQQPVSYSNKYKNAYFTSCSGAVEVWANCNEKAMQKCPSGYSVLEKTDDSNGVKREIHFECKK